jgi:hypothetical protein
VRAVPAWGLVQGGLAPLGAVIALLALLATFVMQVMAAEPNATLADQYGTFRVFNFAAYIKLIAAGIGRCSCCSPGRPTARPPATAPSTSAATPASSSG